MNLLAKDLGVKLEIIDNDFDALIPSLQAGKYDIVVAGMVNTPQRAKSVGFSINYNDSKTVGVTLKENIDKYNSIEQLNGKTIAVQSATTQATAAATVKGAEVLALPSVGDVTMHVITKKADVLFIAEISANKLVEQYPELAIFELDMDVSKTVDGAAIALQKRDKSLKEYLNKKIEEWKKDGTIEDLFTKYSAIEAVE
ncbi:MAG: transporter substrate-binding domain-containing protein, partial [Bacilli bacterium]